MHRHPEPVLPSFTLVLQRHEHNKRRHVSMYKPKSEWKDNLSTGLGGENESGFQNDWAMKTVDRRFDLRDVVAPTNPRVRTRASCPRMRSVPFGKCTKIVERDEAEQTDTDGVAVYRSRELGATNANHEKKLAFPPNLPRATSTSTSPSLVTRDCVRKHGIASTAITSPLPGPIVRYPSALTPVDTEDTSVATLQLLFPPSATLKPLDDASSDISDLALGEPVPKLRPEDTRLSKSRLSLRLGESKSIYNPTPRRPSKSSGTGVTVTLVRSASLTHGPTLYHRDRYNSKPETKAAPPSLTDLRPLLCTSPIGSLRSKSMSFDSEMESPPDTPAPSLSGSTKKVKAPLHLLQPYDDRSFTVEIKYEQPKKGLGGKVGVAVSAILKAFHVNVKSQETKTVNKAINKIVLPH